MPGEDLPLTSHWSCRAPPPEQPIDRNPGNLPLGWKCPDGSSFYLEIEIVTNNTAIRKPFNEGIGTVAANYEADSKSGGPGAPTPYDPFDDARADAHFGAGRWVKNTYNYVTWTQYHAFTTWRNRAGGQFGQWVATLQFEYTYEMYTLNEPFYINNQIGKGGKMYGYKVFLRSIAPYPSCPNGFPDPNVPNKLIIESPLEYEEIQLPNVPQHKKKMECCQLVKEIHQFLGIAKFKRKGLTTSDAFGIPGAKGDTTHKDLYDVLEALILMLANGLIINPKTKPFGSDYQNANATAWASQVFEMLAEGKSDSNTTQLFELHAGFQLVQVMKVLAELSTKVDCMSEMLGYLPQPVPATVPVMFTIHESHSKGFAKKEPKEIDISKIKTNEQVEKILPEVLKNSEIPIVKWQFNPTHKSINAALSNL